MRDAVIEALLHEDSSEEEDERRLVEVAQVWGDSLLGIAHYRAGRVTVGDRHGCDFLVPARRFRAREFPVVVHLPDGVFLQFDESHSGSVEEDGTHRSFAELVAGGRADEARDGELDVYRYRLGAGTRARISVDSLTFLVQRVREADAVRSELADRLDAGFLGIFGFLFTLAFGLSLGLWVLGMLGKIAPPDEELSREALRTIANVAFAPPPPPPRAHAAPHTPTVEAGNPHAGAGQHGSGDSGKSSHAKITSIANAAPDGGVLAALHAQRKALATAFGATHALDDVLGPKGAIVGVANLHGNGTGLHGDGPGAGGPSITVGWGDHGHGYGHDGPGAGPGRFGDGDGTKTDADTGIGEEQVVQIGSLDPRLIDAVIQRHLAQIRYCYERELPAKPRLEGKLVVHFVIEADGRVSTSAMMSSTVGDARVEGCVAETFQKLRFPQPRGGGTVAVNYPLLFKTAGN